VGGEHVRFERRGPVGELILRPEEDNPFGERFIAELHACLDEVLGAQVRVLIVRGEEGAFCDKRELAQLALENEDAREMHSDQLNCLASRLAEFPIPTFVAIQGAALGFGLGLALACDVVYVADDASIGLPFGRISPILSSSVHVHLVRQLGIHRTLELVYTGRMLSGREVSALGLVNRSVPVDKLLAEVRAVAEGVAHGPTADYLTSKGHVRRIAALDAVEKAPTPAVHVP
jgi:2-(1,2-epoxy-1,2-dihydrophenyl)acetyl-CoA isomerase